MKQRDVALILRRLLNHGDINTEWGSMFYAKCSPLVEAGWVEVVYRGWNTQGTYIVMLMITDAGIVHYMTLREKALARRRAGG